MHLSVVHSLLRVTCCGLRVSCCALRVARCSLRVSWCEPQIIRKPKRLNPHRTPRILHPATRNPYRVSRIANRAPRIPHPESRTASWFPRRIDSLRLRIRIAFIDKIYRDIISDFPDFLGLQIAFEIGHCGSGDAVHNLVIQDSS